MNSIETIWDEIARLNIQLRFAKQKVEILRKDLRKDLREARDERLAVVSGHMEGDAGVFWTNEERIEARLDEAGDEVRRLEDELHDCWVEEKLAA